MILRYYLSCPFLYQYIGQTHNHQKNKNNHLFPKFFDSTNSQITHYDLNDYSKSFNILEIRLSINDLSKYDQSSKNNHINKTSNFFIDLFQNQPLTPNFKLSIIVPKEFLTRKNGKTNSLSIDLFLKDLESIRKNVLAIVLEIPSTRVLSKDKEWLDFILRRFCKCYGYLVAIEFEHYSWYQDLTYNTLKKFNVSLIWSDRNKYHYPVFTANFLYLRINENGKKWIKSLKEKEKEDDEIKNEIALHNRNKNEFSLGRGIVDFVIISLGFEDISKINSVLESLDPHISTTKITNNLFRKKNKQRWTGKIIIHVDINSFFSSCEEIKNPLLKGKSHAVIMSNKDNSTITRGVVAACSYESKNTGVRSAMPLYRALELCPNLILNTVDRSFYTKISINVMKLLEDYADIFEQASIDEGYLDCTKRVRSNNLNPQQLAQEIKNTIKTQCSGLSTSIGVATTKSIAKIASDFKKPDGLTIIPQDESKKFLERLDVDRIPGIGIKTQKILKEQMKIQTIGKLAKTDVQKLIGIFGKKTGTWMWQVANGEYDDPVTPKTGYISMSNESTLEHFTFDKKIIKQLMEKLIDELLERIKNKNYKFKTVGIKLVRTDFTIETREKSFSNYQDKRKSIENAIDDLLNKVILNDTLSSSSSSLSKPLNTKPIKNIPKKLLPVRKIGLRVSNFTKIEDEKTIKNNQTTMMDYFEI